MKRWITCAVLAAIFGCGDDKPAQPKTGTVEVNIPGVNVKAGPGGAEVNVPGVNVKADGKGAEVKAPGVEVKTKKD